MTNQPSKFELHYVSVKRKQRGENSSDVIAEAVVRARANGESKHQIAEDRRELGALKNALLNLWPKKKRVEMDPTVHTLYKETGEKEFEASVKFSDGTKEWKVKRVRSDVFDALYQCVIDGLNGAEDE